MAVRVNVLFHIPYSAGESPQLRLGRGGSPTAEGHARDVHLGFREHAAVPELLEHHLQGVRAYVAGDPVRVGECDVIKKLFKDFEIPIAKYAVDNRGTPCTF